MSETYKSNVAITKTKYNVFDDHIKNMVSSNDLYLQIMKAFKEDFKFDIELPTTNQAAMKKTQKQRDELKANGISTYISSGMKKSYEKRKQQNVTTTS